MIVSDFRFEDNSPKVKRQMKEAEKKWLKAAALVIESQAKSITPVDTGNLRSSINHKVLENEAQVGTNTDYAPHVEFGTSRQRAQPYLRPAFKNKREEVAKLLQKYLSEIR